MSPPVGKSPVERLDTLIELRKTTTPTFRALGEGSYQFLIPQFQAALEVDFLRRDGGQLKGEVMVRSELKGARTVDGVLTVADVNLSSSRTRAAFAKDLAAMARTPKDEEDWRAVVEEFALRILAAERSGEPAVLLSDVIPPTAERLLYVDGFPLLKDHPLILFGDGGTGKSMLALHFAGRLALKGHRVGLFDWELDKGEHRLRLGHLFPAPLPRIWYVRCSHPLCREADRLRRVVKEYALEYIVFDSVGYACDGPPEAAEQAMRYFQSLRTLGQVGSLHIAHVRGGQEGGDLRPFGSVFWNNSARATWNIKPASREADEGRLQVALHHRKYNMTGRMRSVGFEIAFEPERIGVTSIELGSVPDLAVQLGLRERVKLALQRGSLTRDQLKSEMEDVKDNVLRSVLSREKKAGRVLEFPDGKFALAEKLFEGS